MNPPPLRGKRAFSTGELEAISGVLAVDIHWLLSGAPSPLSPRFAFRHTFVGDSGTPKKPSDALREQMDAIVLAYHQADFAPDHPLDEFRKQVGTDSFSVEHLPTEYAQIRQAAKAVHQVWQEWLTGGHDPVAGIEDLLQDNFGVDLVVADVPGTQRVNTQALEIAGARVIVVERSGAWHYTLFGIFHELAHLLFGDVSWKGQSSSADEATFEKLANGFAGDVLLSREDVKAADFPSLPLPALAELLWDHDIGLMTARIRSAHNKVEPPPESIRQGDVTLQWRDAHGDSRSRFWKAPSYPPRLLDRHEQLVRTGSVPPDVLAWMLRVPVEEVAVIREPVQLGEETQELLAELGIPT